MRRIPHFEIEVAIRVDLSQVLWPSNPTQYGHDNNRNYINLRGARWRDVDRMIAVEGELLGPCLAEVRDDKYDELWEQASNAFELQYEVEDFPDCFEAAYGLDFGTAAATLALNAAGCPTIMSCNGHGRSESYVGFWLPTAELALLEQAAASARAGLGNSINGAVAVYSEMLDGLLRFAIAMRARSAAFRRIRA